MNEDLKQLRRKIDGGSLFMSGGHQILKVRKRQRVIPEWSLSDVLTRKVVENSFPQWRTNTLQRNRAARWVRVVHLYYRMGMPHNHVAAEMKMKKGALTSLLRNIRRAERGLTVNGTTRVKSGSGRPSKK